MSGKIIDHGTLPNIWRDEVNDKEAKELREKLAEELRGELPKELREDLAEHTLEGKWDDVVEMYYSYPDAHTAGINDSMDTALHVAIDLDEEEVVRELVNAIMTHEEYVRELVKAIVTHEKGQGPPIKEEKKALETGNERGDTPLHVAASRGSGKLCKYIIGNNEERLDLRSLKNNQGETPLFLAALNWNKEAFAYLFHISNDRITVDDLVRKDGDSILHCAIGTEYFDLAFIIVDYFDSLGTRRNNKEITPLKVLANRPSAFRSGIKLSWWKLILYHCILVERLDAKRTIENNLMKMKQTGPVKKFPQNYATLYDFFWKSLSFVASLFGNLLLRGNDEHDEENPSRSSKKHQGGFLPPNYATIRQFIKFAYVYSLGLSGVALKEVKNIKKKHQWSGQLLEALMKRPYEAFTGKGGDQPDPHDWDFELPDVYTLLRDRPDPHDWNFEPEVYNISHPWKQGETNLLDSLQEVEESSLKLTVTDSGKGTPSRKDSKKGTKPNDDAAAKETLGKKDDDAKDGNKDSTKGTKTKDNDAAEETIDKKETPFLAAAKNGIVELVVEILDKIPSAIYNTNSKKQNVLLVAVINRQPHVIETLRIRSKPKVWENLTRASDDDENTMLHLAAKALDKDKPWQIAGFALQMMWDIKWLQYIKSVVPQHFYFRSNKYSKTAGQIFKTSHEELVKRGSEWLKDTSESCSVVAALVAGVSFATAGAVPGGTNDEGKAPLQGQPAFDAFAISSLIGLCFSVTGLIMFLTILTSRKEARDFHRGLPLKLLLGLSSLFVSIIAMFVSFCSGHFFIINHKYKTLLLPFYASTSLPVLYYALAQFPLYFDLLTAIITKVPRASDIGDML